MTKKQRIRTAMAEECRREQEYWNLVAHSPKRYTTDGLGNAVLNPAYVAAEERRAITLAKTAAIRRLRVEAFAAARRSRATP